VYGRQINAVFFRECSRILFHFAERYQSQKTGRFTDGEYILCYRKLFGQNVFLMNRHDAGFRGYPRSKIPVLPVPKADNPAVGPVGTGQYFDEC
jgi:hypothetical protein